jgi:serine/threonine-protein kinase PknK
MHRSILLSDHQRHPEDDWDMADRVETELAAVGFADAVEIGRGALGVVYRSDENPLGRSTAIKVLNTTFDDDERAIFLDEGDAMKLLSGHPNLVELLQVGLTDGSRPFVVMPFCNAGPLAAEVRNDRKMAWSEALGIGVKLCAALETAHRAGTLHGIIKPRNVLVDDHAEPQLSDLGTARMAGKYKTMIPFSGTIAYAAPETLEGNPPSVATDVYSLGATLYAVIAGNAAHDDKSGESLLDHYLRITTTPVPDLRPTGIPADVCDVIERAMSRQPGDRYATAEEFGNALQSVQHDNGQPWTP